MDRMTNAKAKRPRRGGHASQGAGLVTAGLLASWSVAASAHHSISAVYDGTRPQRIEGVVVEFQFVNPHPFVIVTVGAEGRGESWRLEMDNRFELADIGMTSATLKPGDRVIVTGSCGAHRAAHVVHSAARSARRRLPLRASRLAAARQPRSTLSCGSLRI